MVRYKVFSWRIDLNTDEDLENELNKYAKDGWKICNLENTLVKLAYYDIYYTKYT